MPDYNSLEIPIPNIKKQIKNGVIVDPSELVNSNRIDIVFKYIFVKYSMLYSGFNHWAVDLYKQHIAVLNGGYSMPNAFSNIKKTCLNDFVKMFKYLINGFIKKEYRRTS